MLRYGGEEIPLKLVYFKIIKPKTDEEILIKNDSSGNPQMPSLIAEVTLEGAGIDPTMIDTLPICWKTQVEYIVNTKVKKRARKGLDPEGAGEGKDGFLIPVPAPDDPAKDCIEREGSTFVIDDAGNSGAKWGDNFGGGILEITAKTKINNIEISNTYKGKIEGETFSDTFKSQMTSYLENPDADQTTPTIRSQVGYGKFFRVIAYIEARHRHFYPSIYGEPNGAIYPRENELGDGGFGVMQLTDPIPTYEQIWNYKLNIDAGVELIRSKLEQARGYPEFVRTIGCTTPPQGDTYFCRPIQKKYPDATDFNSYELRMDTYSLYNSDWHYWKWIVIDEKRGIKGWQSRHPKGKAPKITGSYYADEAEKIEKNPPSDF
ncbi:MAG TPA: hypothetical protein ENG83_02095 [Nitrospirae bacterium]|nr:hypothetical protein BMS3Bbin15_00991 [archaeon BMS3Bbin15]HDH10993.1 hypothetical protein [Nitrospirota bacterium]